MVVGTNAENHDVQSCPKNEPTLRILEPKGAPAAGGTASGRRGGVAAFLQTIGNTAGFQGPPVMP